MTEPMTDEELEDAVVYVEYGEASFDKALSLDRNLPLLRRLLDEVDRLRAELEAVKDARAAETDEYVRQLRALPGWCRACPPGCASCLGPDCECYEHEELTVEGQNQVIWDLQTKLSTVQDEAARLHIVAHHWARYAETAADRGEVGDDA